MRWGHSRACLPGVGAVGGEAGRCWGGRADVQLKWALSHEMHREWGCSMKDKLGSKRSVVLGCGGSQDAKPVMAGVDGCMCLRLSERAVYMQAKACTRMPVLLPLQRPCRPTKC